ncbi:MAG: FlaA1/EpsC-like NDP-sugar epimerase [Candidatus Azotimanducaceae bacterium]
MTPYPIDTNRISWRWWLAVLFFTFALAGLLSGVSLSERLDVTDAPFLTKAYYSLGLFVVGGLDLGTPQGGPLVGRVLLWIAYFGAPLLTASAVIDAVLTAVAKRRWRLTRIKDHIVIVGSGDLTTSYLRVLRAHDLTVPVVVVDTNINPVRELELAESFGVTVMIGDITHEFLLKELRLRRAKRMLMLGSDDFLAFEAASKVLRLYPNLQDNVIIHCASLRFLRAISDTRISKQSIRFNSYNLAAKALVRDSLVDHFIKTIEKDTVVLAGFGLFGQTILEELQKNAPDQIARVLLIDVQANRRIQIVEEQLRLATSYEKHVLEGDISNPDVWRKVVDIFDLSIGEPVLILGTGTASTNLRTALWLKDKYSNALVFSRTNDISEFALQIGEDHDINCISITQLVEENIPSAWLT